MIHMKYISAQVAEAEDMTEAQVKRLDELVGMMEAKSELPEDDVNMFDLTIEDKNKDPAKNLDFQLVPEGMQRGSGGPAIPLRICGP